jgi:hypothetical protein
VLSWNADGACPLSSTKDNGAELNAGNKLNLIKSLGLLNTDAVDDTLAYDLVFGQEWGISVSKSLSKADKAKQMTRMKSVKGFEFHYPKGMPSRSVVYVRKLLDDSVEVVFPLRFENDANYKAAALS